MKANIGGLEIEYIFKQLDDCDGCFLHTENIIAISNKIKGDYKKQVILHEELHVLLAQMGFNETDIGHNIEEMLAEAISRFVVNAYIITRRK